MIAAVDFSPFWDRKKTTDEENRYIATRKKDITIDNTIQSYENSGQLHFHGFQCLFQVIAIADYKSKWSIDVLSVVYLQGISRCHLEMLEATITRRGSSIFGHLHMAHMAHMGMGQNLLSPYWGKSTSMRRLFLGYHGFDS